MAVGAAAVVVDEAGVPAGGTGTGWATASGAPATTPATTAPAIATRDSDDMAPIRSRIGFHRKPNGTTRFEGSADGAHLLDRLLHHRDQPLLGLRVEFAEI